MVKKLINSKIIPCLIGMVFSLQLGYSSSIHDTADNQNRTEKMLLIKMSNPYPVNRKCGNQLRTRMISSTRCSHEKGILTKGFRP